MKKSIILFAALIVASTIQAQKRVKGNGQMTSVIRTTSDYNTVNFAGSFDYVLVAGSEGQIKIEGEENLLSYIITEVKNGNLNIKTQNNISLQTSKNKTIKITVPFEEISAVSLAGSGDVWNESAISTTRFKVSVTGSGDVNLNVAASLIDANVTGSGELKLLGNTNNLNANVSGSGDFKAYELEAIDVNVSVTGSGDAKIYCNGHLKARVTGSGDIKYKGHPKTVDSKVAGSGSISSN